MNTNGVKKKEVEQRLGCAITDSQFEKALEYAQRKQIRISENEGRIQVVCRWYLVELIVEYVRNAVFSELTMDLCRIVCNMENECPVKNHGTHTRTHIVTSPAL